MPSNPFENLADEVVLEIINHLYTSHIELDNQGICPLNQDIWQVSLCSRRLRRITVPLLYHTIYIPPIKTPFRFLRVIIDFPSLAPLVKTLTLDWNEHTDGWPCDLEHSYIVGLAEKRSLPERFILDIKERFPSSCPLLLLHLLPQIEILHIETGYIYERTFYAYFARFMNDGLLSPMLRELTLRADGATDVRVLVPAFLSPSMTRICAKALISPLYKRRWWYPAQNVDVTSSYKTSNVEELELYHAQLSDEDLEELLRLPRALKSFSYLEQNRLCSTVSGLEGLRRAIDCVAETIEVLDLR
jgi:hypothetical protein